MDHHVKTRSEAQEMFFCCRCSQGLIKDLCDETTACEIILQTALDVSFNSHKSKLPIKAVLLSSPKLEHTQGTAEHLQGPLQASSKSRPQAVKTGPSAYVALAGQTSVARFKATPIRCRRCWLGITLSRAADTGWTGLGLFDWLAARSPQSPCAFQVSSFWIRTRNRQNWRQKQQQPRVTAARTSAAVHTHSSTRHKPEEQDQKPLSKTKSPSPSPSPSKPRRTGRHPPLYPSVWYLPPRRIGRLKPKKVHSLINHFYCPCSLRRHVWPTAGA